MSYCAIWKCELASYSNNVQSVVVTCEIIKCFFINQLPCHYLKRFVAIINIEVTDYELEDFDLSGSYLYRGIGRRQYSGLWWKLEVETSGLQLQFFSVYWEGKVAS